MSVYANAKRGGRTTESALSAAVPEFRVHAHRAGGRDGTTYCCSTYWEMKGTLSASTKKLTMALMPGIKNYGHFPTIFA